MLDIRRKAYEFILNSSKIVSFPLTMEQLLKTAELNGWEIYSYKQAAELFEAFERAGAVNLHKYAQQNDGFTIIGERPLIFYRDELASSEKLVVIAHEMGHIVLGHTYHSLMGKGKERRQNEVQEQEADVFALELCAPLPILRRCRIRTLKDLIGMDLLTGKYAAMQFLQLKTGVEFLRHEYEDKICLRYKDFIKNARRLKRRTLLDAIIRFTADMILSGLVLSVLWTTLIMPCASVAKTLDSMHIQPHACAGARSLYHLRPGCGRMLSLRSMDINITGAVKAGCVNEAACHPSGYAAPNTSPAE